MLTIIAQPSSVTIKTEKKEVQLFQNHFLIKFIILPQPQNHHDHFKEVFFLKFTDVTEVETKGIIIHVRDPHHRDQANSNNNFHAVVLALFYRKKEG